MKYFTQIAPPPYFNKSLRAFLAALAFSGVPAFVCAEQITLPASGTQSTTTTPAISGGITGANSVLKNTDGEFYLDKTNNTYTGGTSITAGTIKITSDNSIGTGTINIGESGTLNIASSIWFSRTVTGSGTVLLGGMVNWTGNASAFAGTVNMNSKSIVFKNANASSASATYQNPDIFSLAADTKAGMITGGGTIRPSNTGTKSGYHILTIGSNTVASGTFSGQIIDWNDNGNMYYQSVTKTGSNTWTLSGTNFTYSGNTKVQGGKLVFSNTNATLTNSAVTVSGGELSNAGTISKAITMTGGTLTNSGTVPAINVTSGSATIANTGTAGTVTVSSGASLYTSNGTLDVVLPSGAKLYGTSQNILESSHKITGAGTIYAWGTMDSQAISGNLSEFTGTFIIEKDKNRGTNLNGNALNASGTHFVIQKTSEGTPSEPPLLTLNPNTTAYVGMISGELGRIRSTAGTGSIKFVVGNDTNYEDHTYKGELINNGSVTLAITKTGSNTWTLTSATGLTYSGATTINGGTLEFTSTAKLPNSAITLTGGTAAVPAQGDTPAVAANPATLKNAGTITQVVTVNNATNAAINNSGTLTGGVKLTGASTTLTLDGTVSLNASSGGGTLTTLNVNSGTTTFLATEKKVTTINVAKDATLTFNQQNGLGYCGKVPNIVLNGGTLKSEYNGYANLGSVTLNGGEITDDPGENPSTDYKNYGSFMLNSGITVTADAKITAGKLMIRAGGNSDGNAGKFTVNEGKTLEVSSEIRLSDSTGVVSSLEKLGAGTMVLTDAVKLTGLLGNSKVKVSGGTLAVCKQSTLASATFSTWTGAVPIEMNGGTLELRNSGTQSTGREFLFSSKVTGTGTISHITTATQKDYATYPTITGDLSGFTGTFALNGTSLILRSGQSLANVVFTDPNEFCAVNTQSIALLTGTSGTIRPSGQTASVCTLVVGRDANETGTFGGTIRDLTEQGKIQAITKTGSNTWILTGSNLSYTGATTVNGGTLQLGTESIKTNLTSSAVTVNKGGNLVNYGTIAKAVTVNEGGTYTGMSGSTTTNGVKFENGSTIAFDLDSWTTALNMTNSSFGTMNLDVFSQAEPETLYEQPFNLFTTNDADILSKLTISSNVGGVTWIPTYTSNTLTLTGYNPNAIPEPATWVLLALGLVGIAINKSRGSR